MLRIPLLQQCYLSSFRDSLKGISMLNFYALCHFIECHKGFIGLQVVLIVVESSSAITFTLIANASVGFNSFHNIYQKYFKTFPISFSAVINLIWLVNKGQLLSMCSDDCVYLWDVKQREVELMQHIRFNRERLTTMYLGMIYKK